MVSLGSGRNVAAISSISPLEQVTVFYRQNCFSRGTCYMCSTTETKIPIETLRKCKMPVSSDNKESSVKVDMLIALDNYWKLMCNHNGVHIEGKNLVAQGTVFPYEALKTSRLLLYGGVYVTCTCKYFLLLFTHEIISVSHVQQAKHQHFAYLHVHILKHLHFFTFSHVISHNYSVFHMRKRFSHAL